MIDSFRVPDGGKLKFYFMLIANCYQVILFNRSKLINQLSEFVSLLAENLHLRHISESSILPKVFVTLRQLRIKENIEMLALPKCYKFYNKKCFEETRVVLLIKSLYNI